MIGAIVLMQIAIAAHPPLVVKAGEAARRVPVTVTREGTFIRGDLLAQSLGGSFAARPRMRHRLTVRGATIEFTDGIPFAKVDSTFVPLAGAPFVREGKLVVPFQTVTELLPAAGTGLLFDPVGPELRIFTAVALNRPPPVRPEVERPAVDDDVGRPSTQPSPSRRPRKGTRRLIVIDAGHGGVDTGMSGPIGGGTPIREKDITLSVSRKVADALRTAGVEVLMTRTTDTLIALSDRGRIANRNKGDMFVSIHVNATGSRSRAAARERGFETYFLAEAKTEEATRVERMENEAVRFETGANAPKGDPLSFIITDMAQNEHLRESNELAEAIQQGLARIHPGKNRGVQQANFAVLRGSFMPAVLVEIGFGTNPEEAAFLSDPDSQRMIATNIATSVLDYLAEYESRIGGGAGN